MDEARIEALEHRVAELEARLQALDTPAEAMGVNHGGVGGAAAGGHACGFFTEEKRVVDLLVSLMTKHVDEALERAVRRLQTPTEEIAEAVASRLRHHPSGSHEHTGRDDRESPSGDGPRFGRTPLPWSRRRTR